MTMTISAAVHVTRNAEPMERSWSPVTPSWRLEQALKHMRTAIAALEEPLQLPPRPSCLCESGELPALERQVA
jgi:hypothetical protein